MQTTLLKTMKPEQGRLDNRSSHSHLAKTMALAAMSLGLGVVQLDITIVNTALSSIGTSLGGSVADLQWVVTDYTIEFAACLWLAWRYAEETPRLAQREIDLLGQIAAITALGALAGALIEGGAIGWSHPFVIMGFAAAAVIGLLFVWREARAPQPMLPLSLFGHRLFALSALVGLLFNIAFYGLIFVLSLYFQNVNAWSPFATGLAVVPMMGMVLPANLVTASVSERLGAPQTIALACVITAGGCLALLPMASGTSYGAICAPLMVLGGGRCP